MELNIYTYKGKDFYLLDELREYDTKFFYGCAQKGPEKIVSKKNILDYQVVKYIKNNNDEYEWLESSFTYKRSKLLVGVEWANQNIPKLHEKNCYKYEDAPPLLELSEDECFKDKDGHILDVEVRGERHEDKVVFKAKDISRIFEMRSLCHTLVDKKSFVKGEDYHVYSIQTRLPTRESNKNRVKPCIFLTYNGLLKVVFLSRSGIAKNFRNWATKVIYTTHLGTAQQREEVSRSIMNKADPKAVKTVLGKSVCGTPCIYLFSLGKVKDLRKLDAFKDVLKNVSGGSVYKWGRTTDLKRRTGEHNITYGAIEGIKVNLEIYAHVDPIYTCRAEKDVKDYFKPYKVSIENFKELVLLTREEFLETKEKYNQLREEYGGCLKEIVDKNILYEQEIKELNYQLTIKNKDISLLEKDLEILNLNLKLNSISK